METITLKLTIRETNLILDALGQQKFVDVYELIDKLQRDARTQLQGAGRPELERGEAHE